MTAATATAAASTPPVRRSGTAYAALVLLAFGDGSGYELKQRANHTLRFFFNAPAMSQIYTELDRLAAAGLVASQPAPRGSVATRRFALTDAGRDELRRWLDDDELAATVFKSHLALRMIVGHLADPDRLRADIDAELARVRTDLVDVDAVRSWLPPQDPQLGWAWLVANWGDRYYRDMLAQLAELRCHLDDPAGRVTPPADRRLDGPMVSLVPVAAEHADALRAIHRDPAVAAVWGEPDPYWPFEPDPDTHGFAIVRPPGDEVVGFIQWYEVTDPQYHHGGLDLFVAPAHQRQGVATAAIGLLVAHLVGERGFHRLVIDPAADNTAAISCYRKLGFRPVGVMRRYERGPDGTWHDGLLMDLLPEQFAPGRYAV